MRSKTYVLHESVDSSMGFAVVGNVEKFARNKHVRKCWRFCQEHQLKAFLVLLDYTKDSKTVGRPLTGPSSARAKLPARVFSRLGDLPEKIDVVIPCLMPRHIPAIVEESAIAGAHTIWFQEKNWTPEFQEQAEGKGLSVVRGCVLKHKIYYGVAKFLSPCYWHGLNCTKALPKYRR
ncbi:MAG: CoA-binding protein [Gracilibacteraceae bacterium]|nr:CoA-binding protein [Gracilibacteraceae bacterium]